MLTPVSAGRHGTKPVVVKLPTIRSEAEFIVSRLVEANAQGMPWSSMAVLYRHWQPIGQELCTALMAAKLPFSGKQKISFSEKSNRIKLLPFHSSKGLEFPVVAVSGGDMLSTLNTADEHEMKLLYVAMTRATSQLIVTVVDG